MDKSEIKLVRLYDAPVRAVWDAWTDPKQVEKWWGPRGFTLTTHSKDLRVGGHWHYTMHGPDGMDYENTTIYHEVEKHARLVYDHGGHKDRPPLFRVTATFTAVGDKTELSLRFKLASPEAAEETRKHIKKANGESTWDRLGEHLAGKDELFIINRSFAAPIEQMFALWTEPAHVAKWLPPTGFEMKFIRADIRAGGNSFYSMSNGAITMYGRAHYHEIRRPDRLVYSQEFVDEKENISRHPMAPLFPESMRTTVTLAAEGKDHTRVTIQWEPKGTPAELAEFVKMKAGMTMGWTGSFDKLEALL